MLWGIDISHHQGNDFDFARARREGISFTFLKATEGHTWTDPTFAGNLAAARQAGLLVAAYHYQRAASSAAAQAGHITSVVPADVPVILDVEAGSGGIAQTRRLHRQITEAGYATPLLYLPAWYWHQIGEPDLTGLPPLWKSRYPDTRSGSVSEIYQRVPEHYWHGYGGLTVAVLQFTSSATVADHTPVDGNAYLGNRAELAALLSPEEEDMTPEQDARLRRIEKELIGSWTPQGVPRGWETDLGPRTVVAMLIGLFNAYMPPPAPAGLSPEAIRPVIAETLADSVGASTDERAEAIVTALTTPDTSEDSNAV